MQDTSSGLLRFMVKRFGSAAEKIAKPLVSRGREPAATPEGFFVAGTEGPLEKDEVGRARSC